MGEHPDDHTTYAYSFLAKGKAGDGHTAADGRQFKGESTAEALLVDTLCIGSVD